MELRPTLFAFLIPFVALAGCASNMNLSEAIIFADRSQDEYDRLHVIQGGSISAEYRPGLDDYGEGHYSADSVPSFRYLDLDPGIAGGVGVANASFAAALSAQFFRLSADVTFMPVRPVYLTANATTSGSYGMFLNARISGSIALGPFFRSDRHSPVPKAFLATGLPDGAKPFSTESFGVRSLFMQSPSSGHERLYFVGVGVVPRVRSVMLIFGINEYRPF